MQNRRKGSVFSSVLKEGFCGGDVYAYPEQSEGVVCVNIWGKNIYTEETANTKKQRSWKSIKRQDDMCDKH